MTENAEGSRNWRKINPLWVVVFLLFLLVWQNRWKVQAIALQQEDGRTPAIFVKLDTFTGAVYYSRGVGWSKIRDVR